MPKEPKYVFSVEVNCRRITDDPLLTSLYTLERWHGELSARIGMRLCNAVRRVLSAVPGGAFSIASRELVQALETLGKDAEKSELRTDD